MQPNLFPQRGTPINDLSQAMGIVRSVAQQAATNASIHIGDGLAGNYGYTGTNVGGDLPTLVKCFEIRSCWRLTNPTPTCGPSVGRFWVCDANPVVYYNPPVSEFVEDENQTAYDKMDAECVHDTDEQIFLPVTSPDLEGEWQDALQPLYGIGQWVWCVFDYNANVWRVLHAYDSIVRFRLLADCLGCEPAAAEVLADTCTVQDDCGSSSSGPSASGNFSSTSDVSASSASASASTSPSSTSSQPPSCDCTSDDASSGSGGSQTCCTEQWTVLGTIQVTDRLNLGPLMFPTTGHAPSGAYGWAKRMADSQMFEVISFGKCDADEDGEDLEIPKIVECCLMDDHPGRGTIFRVHVARRWKGNGWRYCQTDEAQDGIDWRYGTPYPIKGAKGLFLRHRKNDKYIYECISLDCDSPGDCPCAPAQ